MIFFQIEKFEVIRGAGAESVTINATGSGFDFYSRKRNI